MIFGEYCVEEGCILLPDLHPEPSCFVSPCVSAHCGVRYLSLLALKVLRAMPMWLHGTRVQCNARIVRLTDGTTWHNTIALDWFLLSRK